MFYGNFCVLAHWFQILFFLLCVHSFVLSKGEHRNVSEIFICNLWTALLAVKNNLNHPNVWLCSGSGITCPVCDTEPSSQTWTSKQAAPQHPRGPLRQGLHQRRRTVRLGEERWRRRAGRERSSFEVMYAVFWLAAYCRGGGGWAGESRYIFNSMI